MTRAVVLQTAWLGDVLLTTPLIAAAARRHGPVDVVVTPAAVPLVETHPAVREVIAFDKRGADRGPRGLLRTAGRLRRRAYGAAYLAQGSWRTALLARLAGIGRRIGPADAPGRILYTERVARDPARHEAERLVALARPGAPSNLTLSLTDDDHRTAERALRDAGIEPPFAVLAPGSARATKRWPHFTELAEALRRELPVWILDTSLPVRVSAAIIARSTAAVVNDSAPLHLAQAVGTPVVAIFGPTTPQLGFGPRGPHDRTVELDLPCRPCSTHGGARCPRGHHGCMRDLPVGLVLQEIRNVLATAAPAAPPSWRGGKGWE